MMPSGSSRARHTALALALFLCAWVPAAPARSAGIEAAPADRDLATAAHRRELKAYEAAWSAYDRAATAYWADVYAKRAIRRSKRATGQPILIEDYVLTQPPVYAGLARPNDPFAPPEHKPARKYVPVVADVLQAAASYYSFVPQLPRDDAEYKRAYARLAAAAGLTREQVVRIYGFEAGGNGRYDTQAGLEFPGPSAHAVSTALGYNQLLHVNSLELIAEKGDAFVAALAAQAAAHSGSAQAALERKVAILRRMVAFSRTVPDDWNEHQRLADTAQGLGIHAVELDIDIGPLLQTQKLVDSVAFAREKGYAQPLTAAELEMMNLTGDGNGLDMVMMPAATRARVPTSNFFLRAGYERNRVASRNNLVATLIAAIDAQMDGEVRLAGARELAAAYPRQ